MTVERRCDRCHQKIDGYSTMLAQIIFGWNKRRRFDLCEPCTTALKDWTKAGGDDD